MSLTTDWFLELEQIKQADLQDNQSGKLEKRHKTQLTLIFTYLKAKEYTEATKFVKELLND